MSGFTQRHLWLVNNDLPVGVADEYNQWYTSTHIPQLLAVPGFVSGQRFELSPVQSGSKALEFRRFLAVFEIEGEPAVAFAALREAMTSGALDTAPVDGSVATTGNFVALAPRQTVRGAVS